jgi:hypothetical protein
MIEKDGTHKKMIEKDGIKVSNETEILLQLIIIVLLSCASCVLHFFKI